LRVPIDRPSTGLRPVAACGTSPPPRGAGPILALHTGAGGHSPLPAAVEAYTRMAYGRSRWPPPWSTLHMTTPTSTPDIPVPGLQSSSHPPKRPDHHPLRFPSSTISTTRRPPKQPISRPFVSAHPAHPAHRGPFRRAAPPGRSALAATCVPANARGDQVGATGGGDHDGGVRAFRVLRVPSARRKKTRKLSEASAPLATLGCSHSGCVPSCAYAITLRRRGAGRSGCECRPSSTSAATVPAGQTPAIVKSTRSRVLKNVVSTRDASARHPPQLSDCVTATI
jgi:hypothetical protein